MKLLALGCLCAALGGLLVSRWIGNIGVWPWVGAFCEAAAVGALADWFAVVALFRRPLGLPIPHTALIPANKARLADQVADFVGENFLSQEALRQKLKASRSSLDSLEGVLLSIFKSMFGLLMYLFC